MRKKAIITTAVAIILLFAVIAAGLNAVFTITYVKAEFNTFSAEGERDAGELQAKLDQFVGKSTTFFKLDRVTAAVEEYPCFRLESVGKKFPKTIELTVSERKEMFAVSKENGFSVLDEEGVYLSDREENVSRTGGENIVLNGFEMSLSAGKLATGNYVGDLLSAFSVFSEQLGEPRANVKSVTLEQHGSGLDPRMNTFNIVMQEGVTIEIHNPSYLPEEKAEEAVNTYLSLKDGDRFYGFITVTDTTSGEIRCNYIKKSQS